MGALSTGALDRRMPRCAPAAPVERQSMTPRSRGCRRAIARLLIGVCVATLLLSTESYADARSDAKAQVEFGILAAQKGLWREAMYRWERAREIDPTYAAALNNLAVAYEQAGMLEEARVAYERAIALDPNNGLIRENYEMCREIHERQHRAAHR